jgi:uncharacterized phage protein (TIGR02216 family)
MGLSPHEFWRLSLTEWRAILAAHAPPLVDRQEMETLMQEHPDVHDRSQ